MHCIHYYTLWVVFLFLTTSQILVETGKMNFMEKGRCIIQKIQVSEKLLNYTKPHMSKNTLFRLMRLEKDIMPIRRAELNQHNESRTIIYEQIT